MPHSADYQIVPDATASSESEEVFRLRKRYRNIGVVCLLFFVLVGTASAYGFWSEVPPNRRIYAIYFVVLLLSFWGFWAGLSLWVLLAYWRESLKIRNGQMIQQGVIGKKRIGLADITNVRWSIGKSGRITLRTLTEKLRIYLDNFESTERLWLIRFLRNSLPEAVQQDWELFCYKIAIPLREHGVQGNRPPGPDEVLFTRSRLDWYFIPAILLSAVIGSVYYWKLQQPRMLVAPLMPALPWVILRFGTPRQGLVSKRISAEPGQTRFLLFLLWWLGIAIAGFLLLRLWNPPMPHALVLGIIGSILWFGGLLFRVHPVARERRQRDREAAKVAIQQWNEGERGLGEP